MVISVLNQNIKELILIPLPYTKEVLINRIRKGRKESGYEIPKAITLVIGFGAVYFSGSYRKLSQSNKKKA